MGAKLKCPCFKYENSSLTLIVQIVKVLDLAAELDCLMALSKASQEYGYTSPKLITRKAISIDQGRLAHVTENKRFE